MISTLASIVFSLGISQEAAPHPGKTEDLQAARVLFESNIRAIQNRDRDGYLACYLKSDLLIRGGPTGMQFGWEDLAAGIAPSGIEDWPRELVARDLQLSWVGDGLVYGTYRYRSNFAGVLSEGLSERVFIETDAGWRIAVTTAFEGKDVPAAPMALVGATLLDGTGAAPLKDAVILTRDGRIESVGPRASTPVPVGIDVIDLDGKFITPGLIDTHVHYSQTAWADGRPDSWDARADYPYAAVIAELEQNPDRLHRAFLASGVTAVFDVGGYPWTRRLGAMTEHSSQAPHVVAAGPLLTTWVPEILMLPEHQQFVLADEEEAARGYVRSHLAAGSQAIKVWFIARSAEDVRRNTGVLHAIGEEAFAQGLPLVVHATQLEAARVAIEAGASLLVHSVDDELLDDQFVQLAAESGVAYCPTLIVSEGYQFLYKREIPEVIQKGLGWVHPKIRERVEKTTELPPDPRFNEQRFAAMASRQERTNSIMTQNLMTLHAAGVRIVLGTDAGNPLTLHGPSVFREAEAMQAAGLSPSAVLVAATSNAAMSLGRGDDLGVVSVGRIADLLVLDRDPSLDIANLRSMTHVMRAGTLKRRESLNPAHGE